MQVKVPVSPQIKIRRISGVFCFEETRKLVFRVSEKRKKPFLISI